MQTSTPFTLHPHEQAAAAAGTLGLIVRAIEPQPERIDESGRWYRMASGGLSLNCYDAPCAPGDVLYVQEAWNGEFFDSEGLLYYAHGEREHLYRASLCHTICYPDGRAYAFDDEAYEAGASFIPKTENRRVDDLDLRDSESLGVIDVLRHRAWSPPAGWLLAETMPEWASRYRMRVVAAEALRVQEMSALQVEAAVIPQQAHETQQGFYNEQGADVQRWWDAAYPHLPYNDNPYAWGIRVEMMD